MTKMTNLNKRLFRVLLDTDNLEAVIEVVDTDGETHKYKFDDIDEWGSIELANGDVYDLHLLLEEDERPEFSIYSVKKTYETASNGIEMEFLEVDTSEEGTQTVILSLGKRS